MEDFSPSQHFFATWNIQLSLFMVWFQIYMIRFYHKLLRVYAKAPSYIVKSDIETIKYSKSCIKRCLKWLAFWLPFCIWNAWRFYVVVL